MIVDSILSIFMRDLNKLKQEINAYSSEDKLWLVPQGISNSAGTLCYHLIGNLKHFIGAQLGNTGYIRQRDLEFSARNIPKVNLINELDETIEIVKSILSGVSNEDLQKEYPLIVFKDRMSVGFFLIHLTSHLNYHLGQVNYHRRLLDS